MPVPFTLDQTDRQILALLSSDGRASAAKISRALDGVSERAVRYRVDRLVKEGVIHIGAVVDPRAIGYDMIADVFVEVAPGEATSVAQRLVHCENVTYVASSIGNGDLSVQVCARDAEELECVVGKVVACMPGVRSTRVAPVTWMLTDTDRWRLPEE